MGDDSAVKLPNKSVVHSLFKKRSQVKEQVASINGDWGAQLARHVESGNLHKGAFSAAYTIVAKADKNEIAGLQQLDHLRVYLDWAEEYIRSRGHTGDLVELATRQQPQKDIGKSSRDASRGSIPLEEALESYENAAQKNPAPTPQEVDDKAEKRAVSRRKANGKEPDTVDNFRESLKTTIAEGDNHIKQTAKRLRDAKRAPTSKGAPDAPVH